jgi:hypothetical protein
MPVESPQFVGAALRQELLLETLRSHGRTRLRVNGTSMLPALLPYDVLQLERSDPKELRQGAIVLYARDGSLVAHRIARLNPTEAQTRGDLLLHDDPPIAIEEILATVSALERFGRTLPVPPRGRAAAMLARAERWLHFPSAFVHIYARARLRLQGLRP